MNIVKRIGIASSLLVISLGACSQNNSLPISKKKFVFNAFEKYEKAIKEKVLIG